MHRPAMMQRAFDTLPEHTPDDAAGFFHAGMEQMKSRDDPAAARGIMQRDDDPQASDRRLH